MEAMEMYFSGRKLWGDDFTLDEIEAWYCDEKEGYADLTVKDNEAHHYIYHALNRWHAFNKLKGRQFERVLGLGSANGDEFIPIQDRITDLTILEPSDKFRANCQVKGSCVYDKPAISGDMHYDDGTLDLIVALGVLHHIPNVSYVISECFRCLKPGGIMISREPIVSMGDWRKKRPGLTKRERGLPIEIYKHIIFSTGFCVIRQSLCVFRPLVRIAHKLNIRTFNSPSMVIVDSVLSSLFSFNVKYHRTNVFEKFAPASLYSVLEKPIV